MRSMESYLRAAMERAMKVQEVMLQAMAKKITWFQAAEIIGISDRHMRRGRDRYGEGGVGWVKGRLRGAGLVVRCRKRGVHRKRRPGGPLPGMVLHIDGSRHQWFQDE